MGIKERIKKNRKWGKKWEEKREDVNKIKVSGGYHEDDREMRRIKRKNWEKKER